MPHIATSVVNPESEWIQSIKIIKNKKIKKIIFHSIWYYNILHVKYITILDICLIYCLSGIIKCSLSLEMNWDRIWNLVSDSRILNGTKERKKRKFIEI